MEKKRQNPSECARVCAKKSPSSLLRKKTMHPLHTPLRQSSPKKAPKTNRVKGHWGDWEAFKGNNRCFRRPLVGPSPKIFALLFCAFFYCSMPPCFAKNPGGLFGNGSRLHPWQRIWHKKKCLHPSVDPRVHAFLERCERRLQAWEKEIEGGHHIFSFSRYGVIDV